MESGPIMDSVSILDSVSMLELPEQFPDGKGKDYRLSLYRGVGGFAGEKPVDQFGHFQLGQFGAGFDGSTAGQASGQILAFVQGAVRTVVLKVFQQLGDRFPLVDAGTKIC